MKKLLQFAVAVTLTFTAFESKAQLADGSIAPDWTLSDLNGVSHNLYTYLNAGKTVYIDVSAAWCNPCWRFHSRGVWDSLWVDHGPLGGTGVSATTTNDVMVFFIEGEGQNTTAQLYGPAANTGSYATTTQGDWVTGVNHPIIDPATAAIDIFDNNYKIASFPTLYRICPDRSVTSLSVAAATCDTCWVTEAELYAGKSSCTVATTSVDAEMILSTSLNHNLASCDSVTPAFRIGNVGTAPLTSATITLSVDNVPQKTIYWTGNLPTYADTIITGVKVGSIVSGSRTITALVSNPNGSADPTPSNNSTDVAFTVYPAVGGPFISESFESSGIPASWSILPGGSSTWANATVGFSSSASTGLQWFAISTGQVDIMTLPPMSFASATHASMTFDVAYAQYDASHTDRLEVEVSTDCGKTWALKYNKAGTTLKTVPAQSSEFAPSSDADWRHEAVNLNSCVGKTSVLVRLKAISGYGNDIYIDNINFSNSGVGIAENEMSNSVDVYPNPIKNNAIVNFSINESNTIVITLVNALGQEVLTKSLGRMNAGRHQYSLDVSSLNNGFYFLSMSVGNNTITQKVAVNR